MVGQIEQDSMRQEAAAHRVRESRKSFRKFANVDLRVSLGVLAILVLLLLAVFVPLWAEPESQSIGDVLATRLLPPGARDASGGWHVLGTDAFGRDMFVRLWVAARVSLLVGIVGSALSGAVGIVLGALAGWSGGVADRIIVAVSDAMLAIPRLILLIVIAALWGPGMGVVIVVLGLTGWMSVMRLVRAEVQQRRHEAFVEGAIALGIPTPRLLSLHVLPNSLDGASVAITLGVGNAILLESGLSFLGLGIQPPAASWGNMIAGGREWLLTAPWVALTPGILLIVSVVACTMLGEGLRDRGRV